MTRVIRVRVSLGQKACPGIAGIRWKTEIACWGFFAFARNLPHEGDSICLSYLCVANTVFLPSFVNAITS